MEFGKIGVVRRHGDPGHCPACYYFYAAGARAFRDGLERDALEALVGRGANLAAAERGWEDAASATRKELR